MSPKPSKNRQNGEKLPNLVTLTAVSAAKKIEQKVAKFLKNPIDRHQSKFKISKDQIKGVEPIRPKPNNQINKNRMAEYV